MAIGDKQIEPAVVVEVEEEGPPTHHGKRRGTEPRRQRSVIKVEVAIVAKERVYVVREGGDVERRAAVVEIVAARHSHGSLRTAVLVDGNTAEQADFVEPAVLHILKQVARRGIVGDEDVGMAIILEVAPDYAETISGRLGRDTCLVRHLGESTIAVVVEQVHAACRQPERAAHHRYSAIHAPAAAAHAGVLRAAGRRKLRWRKSDVICDEK